MGKRRWWQGKAQHKHSDNHVTIRVDSLQLIIRETYNMGVDDERKRVSKELLERNSNERV
jgi:hypothetical protein